MEGNLLDYNAKLAALIATGMDEEKARATLALFGLAAPAPTIEALVIAASPETARRWLRSWLDVATRYGDPSKQSFLLRSIRYHWSIKGERFTDRDAIAAIKSGADSTDAIARVGTWKVKPAPTDAELDETWRVAKLATKLTVERVARKDSMYANPVNSSVTEATSILAPHGESPARKR
jgi:hypothetical protein